MRVNQIRPTKPLLVWRRMETRPAFDEIYSRHRSFVYSIALRMTGNPADAEDLTQESFVSVFRRVSSFRGRRIIHHVALPSRDESSKDALPLSQLAPGNADE
jgi:DNA-directed RNA polymerase sigma subunit (sigma70/sigma32)